MISEDVLREKFCGYVNCGWRAIRQFTPITFLFLPGTGNSREADDKDTSEASFHHAGFERQRLVVAVEEDDVNDVVTDVSLPFHLQNTIISPVQNAILHTYNTTISPV